MEHAGGFEITCDGANDGQINTTIQGGVTPYTYTWTFEGDTIPDTEQTTDLTGLEPGDYTVTVTDANGCDGDIFEIELVEPTAVTIDATNLDYSGYGVSCLGASDGQINVTTNGGVPTYNYIWSFQGDIVDEWEGSIEQTNLSPGEYTIVAVDQNECADTTNIELIEPPTGITFSAQAVDQNGVQITCDGADDGEINTSAEGGVPPYTYTWTYEGDTIPNTEQTTDLTGLDPGD